MRSKKAQIPTILLPWVAIALSVVALYSMASFSGILASQSESISIMLNEVQFNELYVKEQVKLIGKETILSCQLCDSDALKTKFKEIASGREGLFRYKGAGDFYSKTRNSNFKIEILNNVNYKIIFEDLFVSSEEGENKIRRNFNLCMEFDLEGNYIRDCIIP